MSDKHEVFKCEYMGGISLQSRTRDGVVLLRDALNKLDNRSITARQLIKALSQWNVFNGSTLKIVIGNVSDCDCPYCDHFSKVNAYSFTKNTLWFSPADVALQTKEYMKVPPEIAIAHELIHAWHHATGNYLGSDMAMEEMQTVGLGIFAEDKYTENAIRREYGIVLRPRY